MSQHARFKILINGKWQGGSFGSKTEAEAAAAKLPKGGEIKVVPKGANETASASVPSGRK